MLRVGFPKTTDTLYLAIFLSECLKKHFPMVFTLSNQLPPPLVVSTAGSDCCKPPSKTTEEEEDEEEATVSQR